MTISRGQMNRQLREGGGIMSLSKEGIGGGDYRGIDMGSRTGFGILKKISRGVKKVAKGVKSIAKSDVGKAALAAAAAYYAPKIGIKAKFGPGLQGIKAAGLAAKTAAGNFLLGTPGDTGGRVAGTGIFSKLGNVLGIGGATQGAGAGSGFLTKGLALAGLSTFLTSKFGMSPEQAEETIANPETRAVYLKRYYENLNPNAAPEEVEEFVAANVAEYMAEGGRIGFDKGTAQPSGLGGLMDRFMENEEEMVVIITQDEDGNPKLIQVPKSEVMKDMKMPIVVDDKMDSEDIVIPIDKEKVLEGIVPRDNKAKGDTASDNAMQAAGVEGLPVRQNPKGVKELDLRKTGGFIPPVGIKEKADDIPAMLSNNEFVFTADAVRGAGGGNVELGAQRMYDTMKRLEAGGKV